MYSQVRAINMSGFGLMVQPLYVRIQDELRERIASGDLRPGDRVSSENKLASHYETTRQTVRQALAQLVFEGLIDRHAGLGTFIAPPKVEARLDTHLRQSFEEQIQAAGLKVSFKLLSFEETQAPEGVCRAMNLKAKDSVYRMRRLRLVNAELIGLEDRFILAEHGNEIPQKSLNTDSAITIMDATSAGPVDNIVVSVSAKLANTDVAHKLELPQNAPVLLREHRFSNQEGKVILCGTAYYRGDNYRFSYTLRYDDSTASDLMGS